MGGDIVSSYVYDTANQLIRENNQELGKTWTYDPEIGRFLNADAFASTGQGLLGNNMFVYCLNNPVAQVDYSGEFSVEFFVAWLVGDGSSMYYYYPDKVSSSIKNTEKMKDLVEDAIKEYERTGKSFVQSADTFTLDNSSLDLVMAVRSFEYEMTVKKETFCFNYWGIEVKAWRYSVQVKVWDTYNFDNRPWDSPQNCINNYAAMAHGFGIGKDYYWEANFTYETQWQKMD